MSAGHDSIDPRGTVVDAVRHTVDWACSPPVSRGVGAAISHKRREPENVRLLARICRRSCAMASLSEHQPSRVVRSVGKELGGFKKFLLRGNVVDLAVGIVIGAAFTSVIQALVKDIITPIIGIFGGTP